MNKKMIQQFVSMLEQQASGDPSVIDRIRQLAPSIERGDGYCLFNLFQQWESAFPFAPGQVKTLAPILRLARSLQANSQDDTLKLFNTPEWKELVEMRGPFECAIEYGCKDCGNDFIGFGQSGFDDRYPSICRECGDVWLQSGYDNAPLPRCHCGGELLNNGCPKCRSTRFSTRRYFSSYEYFTNHNWKAKQA